MASDFFFLFRSLFIYLFKRKKKSKNFHLLLYSPRCLPLPDLEKVISRNQEFYLGPSHGQRRTNYLSQLYFCSPRCTSAGHQVGEQRWYSKPGTLIWKVGLLCDVFTVDQTPTPHLIFIAM